MGDDTTCGWLLKAPAVAPAPRPSALVTLFGSSAALLGLAIYQWLELLEIRAGRPAACAVNATIDCAAVWDSPFAHLVHDTLGIPVAGLGVLWGVVALVLTFLLTQKPTLFEGAVKTWALLGLLSCVTFISASVQAQAVCLTCLGTYVLTAVFAFGALKLLGGPAVPGPRAVAGGLGWGLVLSFPVFLALQYPGSNTPKKTTALPPAQPERPADARTLLAGLPASERETLNWARTEWRQAPSVDASAYPTHVRHGPDDAPVRIVEFTDVLCPHCADFVAVLGELEKLAPPGSFSVEPRYYPLDSECNPAVNGTLGNGVRCFGAKLQICSESSPRFFQLRAELFANQRRLDQGMMLALARTLGADLEVLQACIKSPETAQRLAEDLAYAKAADIKGTPLVLVNGRSAPSVPTFLLDLMVNGAGP